MDADLRVETINNTNDGKYLVKIYDIVKNIGKSHIIDIPSFEQNANFNAIGGMYYEGKLYINR